MSPPILGEQLVPDVEVSGDRSLLRWTVATAGGALLAGTAVELGGGTLRWRRHETSFQFIDGQNVDGPDAWFFFPGLGQANTKADAEAIAPALDAPAVSMELPQRKPSLEEIGEAWSAFVTQNGITRIGIYGRSKGWLLAGELLPYLPEDVVVYRDIADCTPSGLHDAKKGARAARIISRLNYPGGILSMGLVEAIGCQTTPGSPPPTLRGRAHHAWQSVKSKDCSPMLFVWQVRQIRKTDIAQIGRNYQERFASDAMSAYIMPDPASNDEYVYVEPAADRIEKATKRPRARLRIPGATHAWPAVHAERYRPVIESWLGGVALDREAA